MPKVGQSAVRALISPKTRLTTASAATVPIEVKAKFVGAPVQDVEDEPAAEHDQAGDSEPKPAVRRLTTEPPET